MNCEKCGTSMEADEQTEVDGQIVCDDCYMDILSPPKACDPWAVYNAKSSPGGDETVNDTQSRILDFLEKTGGEEFEVMARALKMSGSQLQRELATLRHMEKIRGEMRGKRKVVCLW